MSPIKRTLWTKEELIDHVKKCGEEITKNAESIIGNDFYFLNVNVSFDINRGRDNLPTIKIKREFIPQSVLDSEAIKEHKRTWKTADKEEK